MPRQPLVTHDKARRSEIFSIHPLDIHIPEDVGARGRHFAPTKEQVQALANSMKDPSIGQQNPIVCRSNPDKSLTIVSGFTRLEAAKLILDTDPDFRIKVTIANCNEREAVLKNIAENAIRSETSPIDDAHNQRRMREQYGMEDEEIASVYGYKNTSKIERLAKLLLLPDKAQRLVHEGKLAIAVAHDILDIPDDEKRREALGVAYEAAKDGKKVKASKMREVVREAMHSDDEEEEEQVEVEAEEEVVEDTSPKASKSKKSAAPVKSRKVVDVNRLIAELTQEDSPEELIAFGNDFRKWMKGEKSNRWFISALKRAMNISE